MSETLVQALLALRDVDGVLGSFVIRTDGSVCARDLPDYFENEVLGEVGPRIERLHEAWLSFGAEPEATTLVFAGHKLHLRGIEGGFVGVVSALEVNTPALRMALTMVGRRVANEAAAAVPVPASVPAPRLDTPAPKAPGKPKKLFGLIG
jgi:predicted regulator of Ras-like GTPase activity (Roadblock/LC7/MglB family)